MQILTSTVLALAGFLALTSAAPPQARSVPAVRVKFHGSTPQAMYTQIVPLDGTEIYTHNALSVSRVEYDLLGVVCCLYGVDSDKSKAAMPRIANGGQVGPPQTIISISCRATH